MLFAIASLVLSAILMTQADVSDIVSDVTNIEPLSEELYIFDVTSDASVADLKGALESATVEARHSFRVSGTNRYFFVVVDNTGNALSQLTFPKGSVVTQYPVEHVEAFYKMLGIDGGNGRWDTADALGDEHLVLEIREYLFSEGTTTSQMKSRMKAIADAYRKAEQIVGDMNYAVVGRYPPMMFIFVNTDENAVQKATIDGMDAAGGPGNNLITVFRLHKV